MFKNTTVISANSDDTITHLEAQWPQLNTKEQANKMKIYCWWYQPTEALWCIRHASKEVFAYDDYDALKSCVENNHLDLVKAFAEHDAIPSGDALTDILRMCNTKHHARMATYFIDELKVDITDAPEVLAVYLLAMELSPIEYLPACPDTHKKACLAIMGKPIKKSTQELDHETSHNPLIK